LRKFILPVGRSFADTCVAESRQKRDGGKSRNAGLRHQAHADDERPADILTIVQTNSTHHNNPITLDIDPMSFDLTDFRKEVVEQSKLMPVVIDFWAEWCGPCRMLGPVLEKLAREANGKWKLVKINTEEHQQLAAQFGIRSIPAVKMVYQGALVAEFTGALPEAQIRQWLKQHLPESEDSVAEDLVEALKTAQQNGERDRAHRLLEELVQSKPEDITLRAELAMSWVPVDLEKARQVLSGSKSDPKMELHFQALDTLDHLFAIKESTSSGSMEQLYAQSASRLFEGAFEEAIKGFIEVLGKDRSLYDDGARKACVAIFLALGEQHPVTKAWRRKFSMLLY
jgi:putative thioredoxin